jgi:DNA-binding transcriptional MerR regulator
MKTTQIDAHGLTKEEVQEALNEARARKSGNYLPQLEAELKEIQQQRKELERQLSEDIILIENET